MPAQTPDPSDIAAGARLYRQKGNCQACHGWAGDGRKMDSQMPDGSNLRETKPARNDLIETIKCGRPGRDMPAFDKFAYSDGRCFGMRQSDLRARGLTLPDPPATLISSEIETLADFLYAKVIGRRHESFELHRVLGIGSRALQGFPKLTSSAAISAACVGILVESRVQPNGEREPQPPYFTITATMAALTAKISTAIKSIIFES